MSTIGFTYPPPRCLCRRGSPFCPSCRAWTRANHQPGGTCLDDWSDQAPAQLVPCGGSGTVFPLRHGQQGSYTKGQTVYCHDACRLQRNKEHDKARRLQGGHG
jgi:hypothetical protein